MSNNLSVSQLTENQAAPEVTVNDATAQLDAALTEILVLDLTTTDATITSTQFRRNVLFKVGNVAPTAAVQTLTIDAGNVNDAETVTIGGRVYTFQTTLTNVDGHIQIGASNTTSMTNLFKAINLSGVAGTDYAMAMTANTLVTATNPTGTTVVVRAIIKGVSGNAIAVSCTPIHISWGGATLAGATGGGVVNVPAIKRGFVMFETDSANAADVILAQGTTRFTLAPGKLFMAASDGTSNGLTKADFQPTSQPNDMAIFVPGLPAAGGIILATQFVRTVTLPAGLTGSYFRSQVAATASKVFTLYKNSVSIGTLTWAIGGTVPTVSFASDVTFVPSDEFKIVAPTPQDATLADINFSVKASRS